MAKMLLPFFLLFLHSLSSKDYIQVATIEFSGILGHPNASQLEANTVMLKNVEQMNAIVNATRESTHNQTEIFIFPECGLLGIFFDDKQSILPYSQKIEQIPYIPSKSSPILYQLSHVASEHSVFIVIGLATTENDNIYNSAIVFNPQGHLVAHYKKQHLYYEPEFTSGGLNPTTFQVSGSKFGILICFDMLFKSPMKEYRSDQIDTLIVPTWWVNDFPIMTATETQRGFSEFYSFMNVIASNTGLSWFFSGSGIYSNGDAFGFTQNDGTQGVSTAVIANIWKHPQLHDVCPPQPDTTLFSFDFLKLENNISFPSTHFQYNSLESWPIPGHPDWVTQVIQPNTDGFFNISLSTDTIECLAYGKMLTSSSATFAIAALSPHYRYTFETHSCFIIKCSSQKTCGEQIKDAQEMSILDFHLSMKIAKSSPDILLLPIFGTNNGIIPKSNQYSHEMTRKFDEYLLDANISFPLLSTGILGVLLK